MKRNLSISVAAVLLLLGTAATWGADSPAPAPALTRPALQSPKSPKMAILAVARAGKRMLAAGERGIILYSDDNGLSWKQAKTPTSASLTAMRFATDQVGWAVGHMGVVLHTEDGGLTWVKQLDGQQAAQIALAAAQKNGDDRAIQDAERLVADGADKPFFDLCLVDEQTLYIVGAYNLAFRSDSGGRQWTAWQEHIANPKALHLYSIRNVGDALFIAGEQGLLLRSDDRGQHFSPLESPYKGSWFGLVAGQGVELLAYGLRGNAFRSGDLGRSWQAVNTGTPVSLSGGTRLSDGRLVLASQAGEILVSRDQGGSFTRLPGKTAGLPLAAVAEGPDGLVLGSLRGVFTVPLRAQ